MAEHKIRTIKLKNKTYYAALDIGKYLDGQSICVMDSIMDENDVVYVRSDDVVQHLLRYPSRQALALEIGLGLIDQITKIKERRFRMRKLAKVFKSLNLQFGYNVHAYSVDAYSKEYNLVIDCESCVTKRGEYIKLKLDDPVWIRWGPKEDIFDLMGKIVEFIEFNSKDLKYDPSFAELLGI